MSDDTVSDIARPAVPCDATVVIGYHVAMTCSRERGHKEHMHREQLVGIREDESRCYVVTTWPDKER